MLSRVAPWLASRRDGAVPGVTVRVLGGADTADLLALARQDAVANVFILSHLATAGTASPTGGGATIFGAFDGATLIGACWAGANLVPVQLDPELRGRCGRWPPKRSGRRYASIFGPAETVLAMYAALEQSGQRAHEVRDQQPLMTIAGPPDGPSGAGAGIRPA